MRPLLALLVWICCCAPAAADEPLVVDLSNHLVAITTGFSGASVLLFGTQTGEGDVVVVVRGPIGSERVRRRERFAGIWVNRAMATIDDGPAYYRVAATRPLAEMAPVAVLDRHQIGLDHLNLPVRRRDRAVGDNDYRQALLRLKQASDLYRREAEPVTFVGGNLFRTEINFPANVPTGFYAVEVYMMRYGEVISAQTTPLVISKTGLGARIFEFAHRHGPFYGLLAVALACAGGWLAALLFRRR